jgi:transposase
MGDQGALLCTATHRRKNRTTAAVPLPEIINGIFYVLRTGGTGDRMPHDLPPWRTCNHHFSRWRRDGTWQKVHDALRERLREQAGRGPTPAAAVIDSQSVTTAEKGGLADRTLSAMMRASMSKGEKDISWSIPADSC